MRKSSSTAIDIVVTAYPRRDGRFELHHAGRVLCTSREPFCEAARRLLAEGFPPGAVLGLRHIGQHDIALRGRLGRAAELTVNDDRLGVPRFRRWKASRGYVAASPMRFSAPWLGMSHQSATEPTSPTQPASATEHTTQED